jgi:tricorn protease
MRIKNVRRCPLSLAIAVGLVLPALLSVRHGNHRLAGSFDLPKRPTVEGFLRDPDMNQTHLIFICAGELWIAPKRGGLARRVTDHPGRKRCPRFSPDGATIAFVVDEPGDVIYTVPAKGGRPKRLSYYPSGGIDVLGWSPNGKNVLFRSQRSWLASTFHVVPAAGGLERELPMREGVHGCFSSDGRRLVYTTSEGGGSTWKSYRGGHRAQLRIYDLAADTCRDLPVSDANDTWPMWRGETLYFVSDRAGTRNLFARNLKSGAVQQLTRFGDFDVHSPSLGPDAIVFEKAGGLHVLDLATGKVDELTIQFPNDSRPTKAERRPVKERITGFALSPSGTEAVFEAWGELFVVPAGKETGCNLTDSPGVREMNPAWAPNGRQIAYLSDRAGEYELYLRPAGGGPETRLTLNGNVYRYGPIWSPDGKSLLYSDAARRLWMVTLADKKPILIDSNLPDPAALGQWSPDSKWVAYTRNFPRGHAGIALYSVADRRSIAVSDGRFEDRQPVFDRTGRTLYFLSDRDFRRVQVGELSFRSNTGIFALILSANAPSPLGRKDGPGPVRVHVEGLTRRVIQLPIPAGELEDLAAAECQVFYRSQGALHRYDLARQVDETIITGVEGYRLNSTATRLMYQASGPVYGLIDVRLGLAAGAGRRKLDLTMRADPPAERRQMFLDAWRLYRDFFYDPTMHGVDWLAVRRRYEPLLPRAADRHDLTLLLSRMVGELGTSHQWVSDPPGPDKESDVGLLGAEFEEVDGFFRFRKIYEGESWNIWRRAPLCELGLRIRQGDYLLAIDGKPLKAGTNPYALLKGTLGRHVTLRINSRPTDENAREVKVFPTRTESRLRYFDWIEGNRRRVEAASGGRVGYVHIPDCNQWGIEEFVRGFFANADKEALIVDDRYNYGGDNSRFFVDRLARRTLTRGATRHGDDGSPGFVDGPKAMLVNEWCFSNGEFFPCLFRRAGVGPLIGTRTAGGFYGSMGPHPLMDGGMVMVSEMADWSGRDGKWIGENRGMKPDILVANAPDKTHRGCDEQLERAVAYLMDKLKKSPTPLMKLPSLPAKRSNTLDR